LASEGKAVLELFCRQENPIPSIGHGQYEYTCLDWCKVLVTWPKSKNPNPKPEIYTQNLNSNLKPKPIPKPKTVKTETQTQNLKVEPKTYTRNLIRTRDIDIHPKGKL